MDRDRIALIIQGAMAEHLSIDALEMEIDGTGRASYKAADRILDEIAHAIRAPLEEPETIAEVLAEARKLLPPGWGAQALEALRDLNEEEPSS